MARDDVFGNRQSAGGDDRNNDGCRTIARQSADGVLVHDRRFFPDDTVAHLEHCAGQSADFPKVERPRRRR